MKMASYMLYTGLPITAEEALMAGLVSRVVPSEQLGFSFQPIEIFDFACADYYYNWNVTEAETRRVVDSICEKSLPVIRLGKQFLHQQIKMGDIMDAYRFNPLDR